MHFKWRQIKICIRCVRKPHDPVDTQVHVESTMWKLTSKRLTTCDFYTKKRNRPTVNCLHISYTWPKCTTFYFHVQHTRTIIKNLCSSSTTEQFKNTTQSNTKEKQVHNHFNLICRCLTKSYTGKNCSQPS